MSRRSEHLAEMRVALSEKCSLEEARRRLAQLRHRAASEALEARREAAVIDGDRVFASQVVAGGAPARFRFTPKSNFWWDRD